MLEILQHNVTLWIFFSFALFLILAFRLAAKGVTKTLDAKILAIREEIDNAEHLKREAAALLEEYQRKNKEAREEAERILAQACQNAESLRANAKTYLDEAMAIREAHLVDMIHQVEERARTEMHEYAAALAVEASRRVLLSSIHEKNNVDFVEHAVQVIQSPEAARVLKA